MPHHLNSLFQRLRSPSPDSSSPRKDAQSFSISSLWKKDENSDQSQCIDSAESANKEREEDIKARVESAVRTFNDSLDGNGSVQTLDDAFITVQGALELCGESSVHPLLSECLRIMALLRMARYRVTHDMTNLNDAEKHIAKSYEACRQSSPERLLASHTHADVLLERYIRAGNASDLNTAIDRELEAYKMVFMGDAMFCSIVDKLGQLMGMRYVRDGNLVDLDEACAHGFAAHRVARRKNIPHTIKITENYTFSLLLRLRRRNDAVDARTCVKLWEEELDRCLPDSADRALVLDRLALAFHDEYEYSREQVSLEKATSYCEDALQCLPPTSPRRAEMLRTKGNLFLERYIVFADKSAYDISVAALQDALALLPENAPQRFPLLRDLSLNATNKYVRGGREEQYCNDAVKYAEMGLSMCPVGHADRKEALRVYGTALMQRFSRLRRLNDLKMAVEYQGQSLQLCRPDDTRRDIHLITLGEALQTSYDVSKSIEDIQKATSYLEEALSLCPQGTRLHFDAASKLCSAYSKLHAAESPHDFREGLPPDVLADGSGFQRREGLLTVMFYLMEIAHDQTYPLTQRMLAAQGWASAAAYHGHSSVLDAYSHALNLFHLVVGLQSSLEEQRDAIAQLPIVLKMLPMEAASQAILRGKIKAAVEFLEQGRSTLFTRFSDYQSIVDSLCEANAELAQKFSELSGVLRQAANHPRDDSSAAEGSFTGERYRQASAEWNEVVRQIRALPGFASFLKPSQFDELQQASSKGPVILVNLSVFRCDGIIVLGDADPIVVPLPKLTDESGLQLAIDFLEAAVMDTDCGTRPGPKAAAFSVALEQAWTAISKPMLEELESHLGMPTVDEKRRIWWCPTDVLWQIPLHASGIYKPKQRKVPDLYISSYTPSLRGLVQALKPIPTVLKDETKLLVIGQPIAPDYAPLFSVEAELTRIKGVVPQSTTLFGNEAKVDLVLDTIGDHPWIHLACHGEQNYHSPFKSRFLISGELLLSDLIRKPLPNAQIAFLSACNSMGGDIEANNETIHLAAGMQFAGFRSVIGSLWESCDDDAPVLAEVFYRHLTRNGVENAIYTDSAEALSEATKELRRNKVPYERWINFMHYGA